MGGDADLMQDLGNGQLIAVHAGVQDVLFRAKCRLEHPCGKHGLIKGFYKVVGKAFVQQLLYHLFALEGTGHEEGGVPLTGGIVALLDCKGIQPGHKGIQQDHLRAHGEHFLQDLVAVLFHNGHVHALLLQRFAAGGSERGTSIRHQKSNFVHGCFLQCVQFP